MHAWKFSRFSNFLNLLIFALYRKKRVLLEPPTTEPTARRLTDHQPLTHRLTDWLSLPYIKMED